MSVLLARCFPLILAAPSGAGKTTIAHALRARRDDVVFSVSATTRSRRVGEENGRDYWFVEEPEFRAMIGGGELLEWAPVHRHLYGTPRRNLEAAIRERRILLLDIDVAGARQIREAVPEAVSVFILPPSGRTLAERLLRRGSEGEEVRLRRLRNAADEVRSAGEFDYLVVNDRLEAAVDAVEHIVEVEQRRPARIPKVQAALALLAEELERGTPAGAPSEIETRENTQ